MRFKLRESRLLEEKYWVQLRLTDGSKASSPFWFYTTGSTEDEAELLRVLKGAHEGTFKQTLNKPLLAELRALQKGFEGAGRLEVVSSEDFPTGADRVLSQADRALRRDAALFMSDTYHKDPQAWLCHHRNRQEYDNAPDNLVLIERKRVGEGQKDLAAVAHALLHATNPEWLSEQSHTLTVEEWSDDAKGFVPTYDIEFTIRKR